MTDSKEEGELRGTVKCLLPGKERSCLKRMSEPGKENVRASTMVFIGKHTSPRREGFVVPVATLLGTPGLLWPGITSLERQLPILLGQGPLWTGEPLARPGTRYRVA